MKRQRPSLAWIALVAALLPGASSTTLPAAEQPERGATGQRTAIELAAFIDELVEEQLAANDIPPSPVAGDAEFIRRIHLDLTGRVPPADSVRTFLNDDDPRKRPALIDELLDAPEFGEEMARYWAELMVKRDPENNSNLSTFEFRKWLAGRLDDDASWNEIVREMLTTRDGRGPSFFLRANRRNGQLVSPQKAVGTSASLFLGIQLQCAECHDHPYVDEWSHDDFWSLAGFFGRTRFEGKDAVTEADFPPPAPKKNGKKPRPKPPLPTNGMIEIPDPIDSTQTLRTVSARLLGSDATPELPEKGPLRGFYADWLIAEENPYFARAAVNRMWAKLFSRGLVMPLDEMGPNATASHPELLAALAAEFRTSGYDLKHLLRGICNSRAYQRTSRTLPENESDDRWFSHRSIQQIQGEVLLTSLDVILGREDLPKRKKEKNPTKLVTPTEELVDTSEYDGDPSEYTMGPPQLLRLMNVDLPRRIRPLALRMAEGDSPPAEVIDHVCLLTLARLPRPDEREWMVAHVEQAPSRADGYAGLLWVLLSSAEFVSNH